MFIFSLLTSVAEGDFRWLRWLTRRGKLRTPFPAQDYEYLFWKYRLTRFKSEVIYSGKDSIRSQKTHDKKKKNGKPKISGEKMFQQIHLGFSGVWGMGVLLSRLRYFKLIDNSTSKLFALSIYLKTFSLAAANMADKQTSTSAPMITNSYAPNNGLFNCFDDINSCLFSFLL